MSLITKYLNKIHQWAWVQKAEAWVREHSFPGVREISIFEVGRFFFHEIRENKLQIQAAAVTYNFLLAIPPFMLFLTSLVPFLQLENVEETFLLAIRLVTPNDALYEKISAVVMDFMNNQRGEILSFGLLMTLYVSSNGIMALLQSFERSLPVYVKRGGVAKRWTAIKLTVMLSLVLMMTLVTLIIQARSVNSLLLLLFNNTVVIRLVSIAIVVALILVAISAIYTYGPRLSSRMKFVSPGSLFATFLIVLTSAVFFFLVNNFIQYNKVYGSLGTLMAFMIWIWLNTFVILIGYELNISILLAKNADTISQSPEGEKD